MFVAAADAIGLAAFSVTAAGLIPVAIMQGGKGELAKALAIGLLVAPIAPFLIARNAMEAGHQALLGIAVGLTWKCGAT